MTPGRTTAVEIARITDSVWCEAMGQLSSRAEGLLARIGCTEDPKRVAARPPIASLPGAALRRRIEQAIARTGSVVDASAETGISAETVAVVWEAMTA